VDLPGRPPVRRSRLHAHRHAPGDGPAAAVLPRLRAVDGLRGLPASRIKEEHDRTGDNTRSVAVGLERTGRIVTAAAVLISVVFIAFATSGVSFIKIFGLGLTIAVLMDAFVIRATLVPAFMRIAGEANWWAPKWMRRLHDRIGISETEAPEPEPERPVAEPVGSR
jgi:RND superfamily putative drug exporter